MGNDKKKDTVNPDRERIEADRQDDVQIWARAFGVSSDELSGALDEEDRKRQQAEVERKRQEK